MGLRPIHLDPRSGTCHMLTSMVYRLTGPQLLNINPFPIARWVLTGIAFLVSGWFLVANVYPVLATVRPSSQIYIRELSGLR